MYLDRVVCFNEVCTAIKNTQTLGYRLNISVTLVRSLYDKLHDLVDLLSSFGPCHVTIDMGSPVVTPEGMNPKGILDPLELSKAMTTLHSLLKTTSIDYSYYVSIPLCMLDQCTRESIIKDGRILTTCHVPKGSGLIFTPDGSVILCNHFSSFPIAKYGVDFNTAEEFTAFWNSEQVKEVRSRVTTYPHPKCRDCTDWDICGGGCFVKWLQWDPNDYIVSEERR